MASLDEVYDISEELIDRFGSMPEEVTNLLYVVELRQSAIKAGIESIVRNDDTITVSFYDSIPLDLDGVGALKNRAIKRGNRQIKIDTGLLGHRWMKLLKELVLELGSADTLTGRAEGLLVFNTGFLQVINHILYRYQAIGILLRYLKLIPRFAEAVFDRSKEFRQVIRVHVEIINK